MEAGKRVCSACVAGKKKLMELSALWRQDQETLLRWLGLDWLVFDWSVPLAVGKRSSRSKPEDQPIYTREEFETAQMLIKFFLGSTLPDTRVPAIVPKEWQRTLAEPFAAIATPSSLKELFAILPRETPPRMA